MDREVSVQSLLGLPVRLGNVTIGEVHDVILSRTLGHVLGIVVGRRGGREWFVPWIGIGVLPHMLQVGSTLLVLPPPGSGGYDHRGRSARDLLSGSDLHDGSRVGDVYISEEGDVTTVVEIDDRPAAVRHRRILATVMPKEKVATA
jgi:PRC-barrel domain